eukprot:TRINITY_DN112624_c0_g1_i1.p1 TRINITY_DN112624_c0_g1~~TRINITY_DN112624_c0_g1_i1.p1  ORF type:complete len:429 (+),score=88.32 TRINITY_DN112624_c0_g1_i1:93-1379(+)
MGAAVAAPVQALGTVLGGCCGTCVATGCCKLAGAGEVSSARAARCVLVWLQAFAAALSALAAGTADQWLPWSCDKLDFVGLGTTGICECTGKADCWYDQVIYRGEAAAVVVFLVLLFLCLSGCATGAARSQSVAKFMGVFLIGFVLLFLPNDVLDAFGSVATGASALFLVAQALLLIDFAYTWNQLWFDNALAAYRREIHQRGYRFWLGLVLVSAALLILGSLIGAILLYINSPDDGGRIALVSAVIISILLLLVSITDWCEHGTLLTSAVVMAYTVYLVCEAFSVKPGTSMSIPSWLGLTICTVSLISFSTGAASSLSLEPTPSGTSAAQQPLSPPASAAGAADAAERGAAGAAAGEAEEVEPSEGRMYALQCLVHAAAALFICASVSPHASHATFALRTAAIFASLALYGWTLVAPKLLTNRDFGH